MARIKCPVSQKMVDKVLGYQSSVIKSLLYRYELGIIDCIYVPDTHELEIVTTRPLTARDLENIREHIEYCAKKISMRVTLLTRLMSHHQRMKFDTCHHEMHFEEHITISRTNSM